MTSRYTDNPHNISEIIPWVIIEKEKIVQEILGNTKCYFYDACSFRRHANLDIEYANYILEYIKQQSGIIVITRCILMELASHSGILNQEYITYIRHIHDAGITILVMYEEDLFNVMAVCFSTNAAINDYLCWPVKYMMGPVSTITDTLEKDARLKNEIIYGNNLDNSGVYKHFFETVRANKESGDNLGEELLAICLHILSHIPGEIDGKFCIITDDKGAIGKIDTMIGKTARQFEGKEIGVFSTPKLGQILYREKIIYNREHLAEILGAGTNGNIKVLGMNVHDIRGKEISLSKEELADLIIQPNGINIIF